MWWTELLNVRFFKDKLNQFSNQNSIAELFVSNQVYTKNGVMEFLMPNQYWSLEKIQFLAKFCQMPLVPLTTATVITAGILGSTKNRNKS